MKIRSLCIVGTDRELYQQIHELMMHHPWLSTPTHIQDRNLIHKTLQVLDEPVIILQRSSHITNKPLNLSTEIPLHLRERTIIAEVTSNIKRMGSIDLEGLDFLLPEAMSYIQFERFIDAACEKIVTKIENRFTSALTLLAGEIGAQIDQIAYLRRKGYKADISQLALEDMGSTIFKLNKREKLTFLEAFSKHCENALPFTKEFTLQKPYVGVSTRIRKNMTAKATTLFSEASLQKKKIASS